MSDNIKVAIKVRPLIDREKDEPLQWSVSGNTITPMDSRRKGEAGFQFDHIFDMQKRNSEIFNTVVKPIVNSAVNGFNGTVFAYGQTGSGKTYTMMGTESEGGIIPLAINYMFDAIENTTGREFLIRFSYFEIYNEKINDLMDVKNSDLKIKEENGRIFVNECSEKVTKEPNQMLTAMKRGEKNRSIGETNMNERSSRSHTIFRITIESREISSDSDGAIQISQLNLVDLAGSERASQTGATGDRFKEGKHINLSLSTLGLVIKQLSESQDKDKPNFVNFRDSKLTRILQASLGGNSLTTIICTVTPATFEETYCTLSFASRAKSIKNKPELNEDLSDEALLKRYRKQIVELSKELEKANQTIKDRQNNVLADRVELLKEYIISRNTKNIRRRSCPVKFDNTTNRPFALPTIRESFSPETPKVDKIKRRQSIMQNVNMANETIETALADFEIELLQSDLPSDDDFFIATRRPMKSRVKFDDNIHIFNDTDSSASDCSDKIGSTPRKRCNCTNASSPGTPKSILRERLKTVLEEHESLAEFTVLEKQLNREEIQSMNLDDNEKTLRNLKKSLDDTSILYSDVNKKYSDIQTEHSLLVEECGELRKQVESLSAVQDRLGRMEIENKDLHTKLNAALKKQKYLEDENVSQAYQMESMQTKFKAREKDLESSLQIAWKVNDSARAKEASSEILQLQNLVKTLTEEVELLKTQKSPIQESDPLISEVESLKQKLEETNRLLKESDFEKASLVERLDSFSQRSLMRSKIEEYDKLLRNFEEEKILSIQRFDDLAKELEGKESGLEISALQKAVENLSSHLTELEQGDVNVRRKFSVSLACIEFLCQQNSDNKFLDDELDVSQNFEVWKKTISYNEKEKSDIILELQKFRESVIRRSKSIESKLEKGDDQKEDKETLTDEENTNKNLDSVKENLDAEILKLTHKLEKAIVEKQRLEDELGDLKTKLLEAGEKWKDYQNQMLKLEIRETELSELNVKFKKLENENLEIKSKLHEATEKLNNYESGVEFFKLESQFESKLAEKEVAYNQLNSKVIDLEVENLEIKSNLSETLQKLKTYESVSQKVENEIELSVKLEQVEEQNSLIKSQISEAEEKLESVFDSSKLNDDLESQLTKKDAEISELSRKIKEFEEGNKELRSKLDEAEEKLNSYEASKSDNRLMEDFDSKLVEKETELNLLKLQFEEFNLENEEIKFKLAEADEKLKNFEDLVQASKVDNRSIKELEIKLSEKETKLIEFIQKSEELERLNSEIKSQLLEATKKIENYVNFESLKSAFNLEEKENELSNLYSKVKELQDENAEIKFKLEAVDNFRTNESSFFTVDSQMEEKDAEISHLSLRIKELGDENFELKSKVDEAEEKLKNCEVTIETLNSDIERLSSKLQEKEIDLSHLNVRFKELENINNSFTKAAVQSMNNTSEEPFADLKSGVDFVQSYLAENDAIKKRLEDFEKNVSIFRENVDQQKTFVEGLEKDNLVQNEPKASPGLSNKMSTPTKMNQSGNQETSKSAYKSFNDENDFTSIFTNDSYFEKMEVSGMDETVITNGTQNESQEFTAPSMMINIFKSNDVPTLKRRIKDLETRNEQLDIFYKELIEKVNDKGSEELVNAVKEFRNVKITLEMENARLREDLQQKVQESDEVKSGIQGLKMDIEKLQQTIYLLNSENLDLLCKLNAEKEKTKGDGSSQTLIDQLKAHVSQITEEKSVLQNEISLLNEKLSSLCATSSPIASDDEIKAKVIEYTEKVDALKMENRKLTEDLMDKIKELDSIKECKALQYDHECGYKDKNEALVTEISSLQNEITELSDDLMKHIDESETTKQKLDIALKKLEIYEQSPKTSESPESIKLLSQEKKRLEAQVVELKSKVTKLSHENTEFTSNISTIMDELEKHAEVEDPYGNSLSLSTSLEAQSRRISNSWIHDQNVQGLNNKIKTLEDQVEHLTILNTKLSDLKLSSCTQCAHLKELNENKRALKLEVKTLNNKLEELQIKFREKCANTEVLRLKASEDLNTSVSNVTLNGSICEGMNISLMEENIRVLSSEKETLKQEYDKLANLYHEKCSDLETLQEGQPLNISSPTSPASPMTLNKKETRISKVESAIKTLGEDLQQHKEKLASLNGELQKFKELKDKLKSAEESLAIAEEKVKLLESEISSLYESIEGFNESDKALKSEKLNLEVEFEILNGENQSNMKRTVDLQKILDDLNEEKKTLIMELEVAREEKEQLVARQKYEDSNREIMEMTLKENREIIEDSEKRTKEISLNLSKTMKENQDLKNEITRLQSLVQENIDSFKVGDEKEKFQKELESAKKLIIKEMKSLTSEVQDSSNKSVGDLFQVFLKTIMSKEHEIIKALEDRFDHEKLKLEEAKQQSEDAEKRAITWTKTLEHDTEKLQSDLIQLEQKNTELQRQIGTIENELEETRHENQGLRERVEVLKVDYNALHADLENHSRNDTKQGENLNVSQERKRIQASIKDKELELQFKMKQEKEVYNKKIEELTNALKNLESKNLDLKSNVDGMEANEKQLKSIIDIKTKELAKNNQKIKDLQVELEKLAEVNNKMSEENLEKNRRVDEITLLLKNKCDTLSEYKTKVETLMPEYDHLRIQIEERKLSIDKYKEEIETLRAEKTREINLLKDKFEEEEIKSAGLNKQLNELNNKNGVLIQELEAMRTKRLEMEAENEKLLRKIRNSTSKTRVEKEMEDLMDKNRTLENNLEGACNRISELLEAKTKTMKELVDLKGQVENVKRENEELRIAVDAFKSRHTDLIELRGKYEELLQEKNRVKLELEEKKLILTQKDKQLDELKEKNAELDEEAEELAEKIKENQQEIGKLDDENYELKEEKAKKIEELKSQLKSATQMNTDLRGQIEEMKRTEVGVVRKENEELKGRIAEIENRMELKSCASSRSTSPMVDISKMKKRRSDLFNQKRNLDEVSDSGLSSSSAECQCFELRKTIANMGKEIAMKNGTIAALNVQIQSESFPYQKKCKDLQDELVLNKNKIRQLQREVCNLQKTMMNTSAQECEVCKRWRLNQRHQEVQCKMEEKIYLSGTSSGIVGEFKLIEKLEKEKALMRQLCRSRLAQIKQLEAKIEELTAQRN